MHGSGAATIEGAAPDAFSLLSGPIGGVCDKCETAARHEYWRGDQRGEALWLTCGEHACAVLHDSTPSAEGVSTPLRCPGCESWVEAP